MTEDNSPVKEKKTLTLSKKVEFKKIERDQVRQSFSHGRSKTVEVEVKRRRMAGGSPLESKVEGLNTGKNLTEGELEKRLKVLQEAMRIEKEKEALFKTSLPEKLESSEEISESMLIPEKVEDIPEDISIKETPPEDTREPFRPTRRPRQTVESILNSLGGPVLFDSYRKPDPKPAPVVQEVKKEAEIDTVSRRHSPPVIKTDPKIEPKIDAKVDLAKKPAPKRVGEAPRKLSRQGLTKALAGESEDKARSIAALKRARQKNKQKKFIAEEDVQRVVRDVAIPDVIVVSELANRMAIRGAEVVKSLFKMGMMVTLNQTIDGDTAELVCGEFGHTPRRVSDDVDFKIPDDGEDDSGNYRTRPPVVTIMGHVDHGKTSLLDALRETDVAAGEAGGITQHIGAYQVTLKSGQKITFVDTPGHAAFSEMRARGANITDVVVLVVAADDGIMAQTIEAIHHAKAAGVPIVVAINKIDKPDANVDRICQDLLNHDLVLEAYGGDVIAIEVSAKQRLNLDKLEEAILLQAEVLDLKANPDRSARGVVVEAKMDKGRGTVATVLIQKGTLKSGDIFVAGAEWGRVRVLVDDHGRKVNEALPSMPVEVLGFNGVPLAGDEFSVVENESRAREVAEYRARMIRDKKTSTSNRVTLEQMMSKVGEAKDLPLVIKTDVQGSLEAIVGSFAKLATSEVSVRILHSGVGGISESDVTLARASGGFIIGFNVRANPQARDIAKCDGVDIRYYSIIYDVLDDVKALMSGLLAPTLRENYLGTAEIRNVFNISKVGKIAGCYVTDGVVKRGAKVRLLRDNVVIHEGTLKTLRRFKEEVKEVRENYECGMAFENYYDIREGDSVECFEIESITRQL